jgi:hypothetical protein
MRSPLVLGGALGLVAAAGLEVEAEVAVGGVLAVTPLVRLG